MKGNNNYLDYSIKIKKGDIILFVFFIFLSLASAFLSFNYFRGEGDIVAIYSNGEKIAEYPLNIDREIPILEGENIILIKDGEVIMKSATCKNQHCVNHSPINKGNQQIVCLPNKVLVKILTKEEGKIDASVY